MYDVAAKTSVKIDVRDGKPFDNDVVGHYVYRVPGRRTARSCSSHRTNRRQNILEFVAANPDHRRVPRHHPRGVADRLGREQPDAWCSSRTAGASSGNRSATAGGTTTSTTCRASCITPLTRYTTFEAANLVKIDEDAKARLPDGARRRQLPEACSCTASASTARRDVRLTDPAFNHTVGSCMAGRGGAAAGRRAAPAGAGAVRHLARQQVRRRRLPDARHAAGHAPRRRRVRQGRGGAGGERPDEVQRARPQEGRDVHLHGGRRQDDAARASSASRRTSIRRRSTRRSSRSTAGPASASNTARETFVAPNPLDRVRLPRR